MEKVKEISLNKGIFLSVEETDILRDAYLLQSKQLELAKEEIELKKITSFNLYELWQDVKKENTTLNARVKELEGNFEAFLDAMEVNQSKEMLSKFKRLDYINFGKLIADSTKALSNK
jgi:hypothetical protein